MKSELELLKEKVEYLEHLQATCVHEWEAPIEDTFEKKVEVINPTRANPYNVDVVRIENVPCMSKKCKICGKKEYTTEFEEVAVKTETRPKFR